MYKQFALENKTRQKKKRRHKKMSFLKLVVLLTGIASVHAQCVKMVSLGDWGARGFFEAGVRDAAALDIAPDARCDKTASNLLLLGDNFYELGVKKVDDKKFKTYFTNGFQNQNYKSMKMFPILGNHDYYGNVKPQVEFTKADQTKRWDMPATYYSKRIEQNGVSIYILFIDTWALIGGNTPDLSLKKRLLRRRSLLNKDSSSLRELREEDFSPEERVGIYRDLDSTVDPNQMAFIRSELKSSNAQTADWRIVVGHYPLYSPGGHGDVEALQKDLNPLFEAHNVSAYLFGHDHMTSVVKKGKIIHYLNGASGKTSGDLNFNYQDLLFGMKDEYGYMTHIFTKQTMTTTVHRVKDSKDMYVFTYVQNRDGSSFQSSVNFERSFQIDKSNFPSRFDQYTEYLGYIGLGLSTLIGSIFGVAFFRIRRRRRESMIIKRKTQTDLQATNPMTEVNNTQSSI